MPVRPGAVRLQARDDADGEVALARQRPDGGRDGAGSNAGDLAEQATPVQTVGARPLGDGEHDLPVRHRREERRVQPLRPDREALGQDSSDRSSGTCTRTRAGSRACTRRSEYAQTRGRARRRRGTCQRPARPRGATGRTRARSARRKLSAGAADDRTPAERAATPGAVGACRPTAASGRMARSSRGPPTIPRA